jgi:hypothetical protein
MNKVFDYNGTFVSPSNPVKSLRTVKKIVSVDSGDRDSTKFYTNGEFTVSLPRVYENVVSIRLMAAEFPPLVSTSGGPGAVRRAYKYSSPIVVNNPPDDQSYVLASNNVYYFLVEFNGLNKTDECALDGDRSANPDGFFAKIPVTLTSGGFIEYNDHSGQENIARYSPAIGKLDRLQIKTRLHTQKGVNNGFIYWTTDGGYDGNLSKSNQVGAEFSLTLEIECLENSFDDFSQFESRLSTRG